MESKETPNTPESLAQISKQPAPAPESAVAAAAPHGAIAPTEPAHDEAQEANEDSVHEKTGLFAGGFKQFFKDITDSLDSKDEATRRMAWLFFVSVFGMLLVTSLSIYRIKEMRSHVVKILSESEIEAEYQKRLAEYREADERLRQRTFGLGRFVVPLKDAAHATADFNLSVICADMEVCEYLQTHTVEAKSEVTSALIGTYREDFLSIGGKQRVRRRLLGTLSTWIDREYRGAKIENVYFTELSVN